MTPAMDRRRPRCAVQVDMDSFAVMLRYYGYHDGPPPEAFYDRAVPRLLDVFARFGIRATFFVIGSDVRGAAGEWLGRMRAAGHEVANHSEHHPFCLPKLPLEQLEAEVASAEEAITARIGERPVGFRSPGYDVDERLIELLASRGYWYDASVFPTSIMPVIRLRQAFQRTRHPAQHGSLGRPSFLLAPRHPYRPDRRRLWRVDPERPFVEIPVATLPFTRLPYHGTAQLAWGEGYAEWGWRQLPAAGDLSFAMHGVDVLGPDRDPIDPRLFAQPGVRRSVEEKQRLFSRVFGHLAGRYTWVTSKELAQHHCPELRAAGSFARASATVSAS